MLRSGNKVSVEDEILRRGLRKKENCGARTDQCESISTTASSADMGLVYLSMLAHALNHGGISAYTNQKIQPRRIRRKSY